MKKGITLLHIALIMTTITIIATIMWEVYYNRIYPQTKYLYSLQDNISSKGNLFLGCGVFKGEHYYFYYEKIGENSYKSGKVLAEKTVVIESDNKPPQLKIFREGNKPQYEITIPKNSIIQGYKLDLQ